MMILPRLSTSASRIAVMLVAAASLLAISAPSRAADDKVLAKVNGTEIHESDLKLAEEELGPSLPPQMDPATKRDNILNYLIDMRIVSKAADSKKLADSEDFKRRMAFVRERLLMETFLTAE